jgi:hypothetical protein
LRKIVCRLCVDGEATAVVGDDEFDLVAVRPPGCRPAPRTASAIAARAR